jgi:hypothetical protein
VNLTRRPDTNILAMDLGKNKTVFCEYDSKTAEHKFGKVKTSPRQIHDMLVERAPDKIVFEICSAAGWFYDIAEALGLEIEVKLRYYET